MYTAVVSNFATRR